MPIKQAGIGDSIKGWYDQQNPMARDAVVRGLIGALIGGGAAGGLAAFTPRDPDENKRKAILGPAALGALLGGGAAASLPLAGKLFNHRFEGEADGKLSLVGNAVAKPLTARPATTVLGGLGAWTALKPYIKHDGTSIKNPLYGYSFGSDKHYTALDPTKTLDDYLVSAPKGSPDVAANKASNRVLRHAQTLKPAVFDAAAVGDLIRRDSDMETLVREIVARKGTGTPMNAHLDALKVPGASLDQSVVDDIIKPLVDKPQEVGLTSEHLTRMKELGSRTSGKGIIRDFKTIAKGNLGGAGRDPRAILKAIARSLKTVNTRAGQMPGGRKAMLGLSLIPAGLIGGGLIDEGLKGELGQ
jgi:hypothetical protein